MVQSHSPWQKSLQWGLKFLLALSFFSLLFHRWIPWTKYSTLYTTIHPSCHPCNLVPCAFKLRSPNVHQDDLFSPLLECSARSHYFFLALMPYYCHTLVHTVISFYWECPEHNALFCFKIIMLFSIYCCSFSPYLWTKFWLNPLHWVQNSVLSVQTRGFPIESS